MKVHCCLPAAVRSTLDLDGSNHIPDQPQRSNRGNMTLRNNMSSLSELKTARHVSYRRKFRPNTHLVAYVCKFCHQLPPRTSCEFLFEYFIVHRAGQQPR